MTAAGIALIAGGLATLICFRAVLFGAGRRRARRQAGAPETSRRGSRRRTLAAAFSGQPGPAGGRGLDPSSGRRSVADEEDDRRGGLASIGLADEDDEDEEYDEAEVEEYADDEVEEAPVKVAERPDRYGQRVDGWVRPEYRDVRDEPPSGEYWTPIPVDLAGDPEPSAKGYGWPVPVERLPAVPQYEPATGFDLEPIVSEPTEVVPPWPGQDEERPGRIRLPRSWGARNEARSSSWAVRNEKARDEVAGDVGGDEPPAEERRRRPRPRPRPEKPADRNTTVYVSRHAAEPPR
jgi:hypothetical protein